MNIEISSREVLKNLTRFKDSLLSHPEKGGKDAKREYKVLLNCHTGEMRFAKKIGELESALSQKTEGSLSAWKEVRLIVSEGPDMKTHFGLDAFDEGSVDHVASRIAKETLDVLNKKAQETKGGDSGVLPEEMALKDLSSIRVRENVEEVPGWAGKLTREDAEKRLESKREKTYLIREGYPEASEEIRSLAETNQCAIQYYFLTFSQENNRVSESLILRLDRGWILYQDEPDLSKYRSYPTLEALLKQLAPDIQYPLDLFRN